MEPRSCGWLEGNHESDGRGFNRATKRPREPALAAEGRFPLHWHPGETNFNNNTFTITLSPAQDQALELMLRAALIESKRKAIHKQIDELVRYAPRDTNEADEVLRVRTMVDTHMRDYYRCDEGDFPRDRSAMREINFD